MAITGAEMMAASANAAAVAVSLAACAIDVRTQRIPNRLTFGAAGAALLFHAFAGGAGAAGVSVAGWIMGAVVFAPLFMVGGMGAGDVKLVAALGAWLGPVAALHIALYSAIVGGVMAIVVSLAHGYLRTAVANLRVIAMSWRFGIATVPGLTLADARGPRLTYAIAITVGTGVTVWLR